VITLALLAELASLTNLLTFGAFALIMGVVLSLGFLAIRISQDPIRDRLESLVKDDAVAPSAGIWEGLANQLPQTRLDNGILDRELRRAGFYRPTARSEFLGLRNGLVFLALIGAGIIAVGIGPSAPSIPVNVGKIVHFNPAVLTVVIGVIVAMCCWAIPRLVLQYLGHRRVKRVTDSLPFAMDMLTMTMQGGLTLRDALYHVSREIYYAHPALAVELLIIRQHAELTSVDNAFDQFGKRIDSPEVIALTSLIQQGQRLGTDVVTSINEFADSLRLKRRQTADARSNRAAIQMLFPLVLLMVPAVMIVLWGPAVLRIFEFVKTLDDGL
jgi:tight adherence protein C